MPLTLPWFCTYIVRLFVAPTVKLPQFTEVTGVVRFASQYTPRGPVIEAADTFNGDRWKNRFVMDIISSRAIAAVMIKRFLAFKLSTLDVAVCVGWRDRPEMDCF